MKKTVLFRFFVPLSAIALLAGAGCGGDDDDDVVHADARPIVDAPPAPDTASSIDAAPTPDADTTDADTTDADTTDADTTDADTTDADTTDADTTDANPAEAIVINEFLWSHASTDSCEFVEVFAPANADLSDLTLLIIEGDSGSNQGVIDVAIPLTSADANGYWWTDYQENTFENGTQTALLVRTFTGSVDDDLDTTDPEDGTFDTTPWAEIVDSVAVNDGDTDDLTYAGPVLDPAFTGGSFPPGGASRIPNGTDTDSQGDWVQNAFNADGTTCGNGTAASGEAISTPNAENQVQP